jgi:DNA polymerase III subunit epsilon
MTQPSSPSTKDLADLAELAARLEVSPDYRVLRRLNPPAQYEVDDSALKKTAVFLDVETTGLDAGRHEIIELAMVPFTYSPDGRIFDVRAPFQGLREPSHPIPPEVTAITGIDDAMVAGKTIDVADVSAFIEKADLIIAHNAGFDRRFMELFCEDFMHKPWACSMSQVDWQAEGFETLKLAFLASTAGFFYDKHRAVHDCHAAIELLARPLPKSRQRAMAQLLEKARAPSWRIWASHAPFEMKDALRHRGYRWNAEGIGAFKAWTIEVPDALKDEECRFLQEEIYGRPQPVNCRKIDAFDRFSARV